MMSFPGNHIQATFPLRECPCHKQLCRFSDLKGGLGGLELSYEVCVYLYFAPLSLL